MTSNPLRIRRGNPTPEQLARGFRDAERYPEKAATKPRRRPAKTDGGLVPTILRLCQMRRLWAWRVNSGTVMLASGHRIMLAPPGTPDVLLVLPGGLLAGIEAKRPTGLVRASQRAWEQQAIRVGVRYAVVHSAKETIETLDRWIDEVRQ